MKIKFLGTAAAEGVPAIFCECEACKKSRALGGKNIRTRSHALIDDYLMMDFPGDAFLHFLTYNIPMEDIEACLITHSHNDHLYTAELEYRKEAFTHRYNNDKIFTMYSDKAGYDIVCEFIEKYKIPDDTVRAELITPFVPFEIKGYKITALRAAHAPETSPVVYLIEKDGKTLLYSHDSSEYPEESIEFLKAWGGHIDFITSDCTEGTREVTYIGHMNLQRNVEMKKHFDSIGITDDKTIWAMSHFSHNGGLHGGVVTYDEFSAAADEYGFVTAYDGLEIEF